MKSLARLALALCLLLVFILLPAFPAEASCRMGRTKYSCYNIVDDSFGSTIRKCYIRDCAWTQVEATTACTATRGFMWWNRWLPDSEVIGHYPIPGRQGVKGLSPGQTKQGEK
jgi:hypothetical protein